LGEIEVEHRQENLMALSEAFLVWEQQTQSQSKQEATQAIALNLLKQGISVETIAQATGLTIAQLQQLQSQVEQN
jgi:predicted transposase/invertase (TIGR01784 family)